MTWDTFTAEDLPFQSVACSHTTTGASLSCTSIPGNIPHPFIKSCSFGWPPPLRWWRRPSSMPPVPRDDSHNTQHSSCGFDDSSQNSQRQSTSTSTPFVSLSLGWIQSPPKQLQGQVVCKKNCLSAFSGEQSLHRLPSNGRLDKRISLTGRSAAGRRQLLHTQSCFPYLPSEAAGCPHRFIHAEC